MSSQVRRSAIGFLALTLLSLGACGAGQKPPELAQNTVKSTGSNSNTVSSDSASSSSKPEKPKGPIDQNLPRDGKISQLVARILEQYHYNQSPFDNEMSQRMLKGYMDALDYSHLIFLQSDYDEFLSQFGNELDKYTIRADASPAFAIYQRFLQRLDQRVALVDKLLKEKYDFTGTDRFQPNRASSSNSSRAVSPMKSPRRPSKKSRAVTTTCASTRWKWTKTTSSKPTSAASPTPTTRTLIT